MARKVPPAGAPPEAQTPAPDRKQGQGEDMLTPSEIASLRRDGKEKLASAQKAFNRLKAKKAAAD